MQVLAQANTRGLEELGDLAELNKLSDDEKDAHSAMIFCDLRQTHGEAAYDELPQIQKDLADLLEWLGCCMHKELNSVKAGNKGMREY
jgi:hypothetical protein